jgi:sensor histidine kinase regulating citrate/malate metabolism
MICAIAAVEIVMLSILIVNSIAVMSETSRERMEMWTTTMAELFSVASPNAALSLDVASLKELALMLKRHQDVVYVSVEDADGILLAHNDPAQVGRPNTATADEALESRHFGQEARP